MVLYGREQSFLFMFFIVIFLSPKYDFTQESVYHFGTDVSALYPKHTKELASSSAILGSRKDTAI